MILPITGTIIIFSIFPNIQSTDFHKFGCKFDETDYTLKQKIWSTPIFGTPVCSALYIPHETRLKHTINAIHGTISEVISKNNYNNLDVFLEFYTAFKSYKNNNLKEFFNQYEVPFRQEFNYALVIAVLDRLTDEMLIPKDSVYLGTANLNVNDEFIEKVINSEDIPDNFKHNHVFGVININYAERPGYIVIDPANGAVKPIFVFHNATLLGFNNFIATIDNKNGENYNFHYQSKNKNYLIADVTTHNINADVRTDKNEADVTTNNDQANKKHIYVIKKPFCSFTQTTIKYGFFNTSRFLMRRNDQGYPTSIINFYLNLNKHSYFQFNLFDENQNQKNFNIEFSNNINHLPTNQQEIFDDILKQMKYPQDDFKKLIESLYLMTIDSDFFKQLSVFFKIK